MEAVQGNAVRSMFPDGDAKTTYGAMSIRAMILEMQRIMKKMYDMYVECQGQLEQNATQLQLLAYDKAIEAKDQRLRAEIISGALGIVSGVVGLGVGGGFGLYYRNTDVGFTTGLDIGSHLSTPATGIFNSAGQMWAGAERSKAEDDQIHSDLARNVSDSAERDASKVGDSAGQHHQQYLQDASQLTQEAVALLKATVIPR